MKGWVNLVTFVGLLVIIAGGVSAMFTSLLLQPLFCGSAVLFLLIAGFWLWSYRKTDNILERDSAATWAVFAVVLLILGI